VESCLEADPRCRPSGAAEVAAGLRRWLARRAAPAVKPARRYRTLPRWAAAAAAVLTAAGLLAGMWAGAAPAPKSPEPGADELIAQGRACLAEDDFIGAQQAFTRADKLRPDDGRAQAYLAVCLLHGREGAKAAECCAKAAEKGLNTAGLYNNWAYALLKINDAKSRQEAIRHLDVAVSLDPNLQAAWYNRAIRYLSSPRNDKAALNDALIAMQRAFACDTKRSSMMMCDAANLFTNAAMDDPQWADSAIDALKGALRLGQKPNLGEKGHLHTALKNHPEWDSLASIVRDPQAPRNFIDLSIADPAPTK
jgi:tetratricopeptide (TPR) repeat protein